MNSIVFDGSAAIVLPFGEGCERFRLAIEQLREHDALLRAHPLDVVRRLRGGQATFVDIRETLRLGLAGGGLVWRDAEVLIRKHVDEAPIWTVLGLGDTASMVLSAAMMGPASNTSGDDEPDGEAPKNHVRFDFQRLYRTGAAMGFTPEETGRMSIWEFSQALEGVLEREGKEPEPPMPSDARAEELLAETDVGPRGEG